MRQRLDIYRTNLSEDLFCSLFDQKLAHTRTESKSASEAKRRKHEAGITESKR